MNGRQRIEAALKGERPDTTPIMLHNFMMAAREAGITMAEYRRSPEAIARTFIQAVETYGYDGVVVDVDTATVAGALGVPVDLPDDAPASAHRGAIDSLEAAAGLPAPDIARDERVQVWLEATRLLVRHFGSEIYIRGNCDQATFSLAALVRGIPEFLEEVADPGREEAFCILLDYCHRAVLSFITLMSATGAHMVSNGDSTGGTDVVSPAIYRRYAQPYERRIAAHAHEAGLPWLLHICGKTDRILADMAATGADALELDYKTDVELARLALRGRAAFVGNIDPSAVLAMGTPELVAAKTRQLLAVFKDEPRFILNAGCGIPATTPPENLRAMIRAARG
ncbi:MAG TPA: uroporphyrinogen decarboxylase family protein [Bryobacteraceae bacterium]|nr:uroporphyrinogen decarboxylase family protein [Bryobacteraceae bacterium]